MCIRDSVGSEMCIRDRETDNRAVTAYTTLTLVRHIYISNTFPERRSFTKDLLELSEERLKPVKI
jgi:hypothetical protein